MRFDTVLIDVDDTLFDFRKSSFEALVRAFAEIGVTFTEEDMLRYEVFNDQMWKSYELGEIEKDFIYAERFRRYFASIGLDADPVAINRRYLLELAEGRNFMPHCKELLQALHGKYLVVVVTNGDTYAQERRIERSGMVQYFDYVFISEQLGTKKPEKDFYDKVFAQIGEDPAQKRHHGGRQPVLRHAGRPQRRDSHMLLRNARKRRRTVRLRRSKIFSIFFRYWKTAEHTNASPQLRAGVSAFLSNSCAIFSANSRVSNGAM